MEHLTYDIRSGDFTGAGAASRDLKQHLKRIGAESDSVRRAMIAAYEAEMNVVIHADGGRLEATVSDGQLDVDVVDRGPGIPDIPRAMHEGFSTASSEARALGFGAGMGLPNIERNSDRIRVTSTVGEGTRVSFSVMLRPEAADQGARPSSLGMVADLCRDCRHCLVACPTAAVRVRDGRPSVMDHVCVDCTCCIESCAPGALTMLDAPDGLRRDGGVLAVPPALLAGFGEHPAATVLEELRALGFSEVLSVHPYEDALRREVLDLAATSDAPAPLISPVCPAVVNLVELKFPSLVKHLAPLASPWEAVQRDLGEREATYAVSCPSQRTALLTQRPTAQRQTVTVRLVREALLPRLAARRPAASSAAPLLQAGGADDLLVVTGVSHVLAVLEEIEDGRLGGVAAVEPYICDGGCFGSPLLGEDAYVASWRWAAAAGVDGGEGRSHERSRPFHARPGIRLDADMAVAIGKLAQLDAETEALPGKDCGVCGAPTCAALAEDIVMGRAGRALCPYVITEEGTAS
jgi:anti-sigma regulatory factor (Ser/Thr protein kinase)/Na+-translocating ferredoxin:NAD+ oxidoreductase RNF subunit RnfB